MLNLISKSAIMEGMVDTIKRIALCNADVLIVGETGTGKEVVARHIHDSSQRKNQNFVAVNCCAIPEDIIESELFGHEAGAFTGASKCRIGKFEHADRGTLFLDEIDSMSVHMQAKLLRVLQERQLERLGSNKTIPLDVRIISSTKKDLKQASTEGQFREDLFYRLNVVTINIPPLRDRPDDILILFQYFLGLSAIKHDMAIPILTREVVDRLLAHQWPGNVRELKNVAERFSLGCEIDIRNDDEITSDAVVNHQKNPLSLAERVADFEKSLIHEELVRNNWSIQKTYAALQIPRKTLYERMKKYGLVRPKSPEAQANHSIAHN